MSDEKRRKPDESEQRRSSKRAEKRPSPKIEGTMPHQINAPVFPEETRKHEKPFVNKYGVVIGDSHYESEESPLQQWSEETDPAVMAGDEWVHPTNDIGWNTTENRDLIEKGRKPNDSRFMHPTKDAGYGKD